MAETKKKESIKFYVKRAVFKSADGFRIFKGVAYEEKGMHLIGNISVKGYMADIEEGDELFAVGDYETHPRYGATLNTRSYMKCLPATSAGILTYLKQGNIKGITEKRAVDIVARFHDRTFDVLLKNPERLTEINGIGPKSAEKIKANAKEALEAQSMMSTVMMYIQQFGISPAYAKRIYDCYGIKSMEVLRTNPYQLAEDVKLIGFVKADQIALANGVKPDSQYRLESGVLYYLAEMSNSGHVFGTEEYIVEICHEKLLIGQEIIENTIKHLEEKKKIIRFGETDLYLPYLYYAEKKVAENLLRTVCGSGNSFEVEDGGIQILGKRLGREYDIEDFAYAPEQVEAIKTACRSSVSVITGGPGTGKTTIIKAIIRLCKERRLAVSCAAPTGKAAKRMQEATGEFAQTIHRLLEAKYDEVKKAVFFTRDENHPLDADVLIVDECSMIDTVLFDRLLRAVPDGMKVILVGDADQLPSVGCGNIFYGVIHSGVVPVVALKKIQRQAEGSRIVKNAHLVNNGKMPDLKQIRGGDFFFLNVTGKSAQEIRDKTIDVACRQIPNSFPVGINDVQVLSPTKKHAAGTYEINSFIQSRKGYTEDTPHISSGGTMFYKGDKIICMKNDYEYGVFNGDIGIITDIKKEVEEDEDQYFEVTFDDMGGTSVKRFPFNKLHDFTLAYALTVHKSQGSEYDYVVMILSTYNGKPMLQRNILYTGMTRAKKCFVLVGDMTALRIAVHTMDRQERNTHLEDLLRDGFSKIREGDAA